MVDRPAYPASMRPRVFPAEDEAAVDGTDVSVSGFNEAAGIPRGRRAEHPAQAAGVLTLQ